MNCAGGDELNIKASTFHMGFGESFPDNEH